MGPIFEKSYDEFMVIINYQCKKISLKQSTTATRSVTKMGQGLDNSWQCVCSYDLW